MINSKKTEQQSPKNLFLSIFSKQNKVIPVVPQTEKVILMKSAKNSPMMLHILSPLDKNKQCYRFNTGENLQKKAKDMNFPYIPAISKFEIEENEDQNNLIKEDTCEIHKPQCRICLEEEDGIQDLISPCKCKGFQKFVHMKCLKLWLLNSDKNEIDISSCEVCKSQFSMSLIYENFIAPCAQNSCKAWIPCIIAIFLMLSILTLYFQGYLNNNPT